MPSEGKFQLFCFVIVVWNSLKAKREKPKCNNESTWNLPVEQAWEAGDENCAAGTDMQEKASSVSPVLYEIQ